MGVGARGVGDGVGCAHVDGWLCQVGAGRAVETLACSMCEYVCVVGEDY